MNGKADNSIRWNINTEKEESRAKWSFLFHNICIMLSGVWGFINRILGLSKTYTFFNYDGTGKIAIVSGGASGMGKEIARRFVNCGVDVTIIDCDSEMGKKTVKELSKECKKGGKITFCHCDYSSFASVRSFAKTYLQNHNRLDLLMNNAGTSISPQGSKTEDGYNPTFQINYLSHFLLTKELLHIMPPTTSRIVNTCSVLHRQGQTSCEGLMIGATHGEPYSHTYADSKQALVLMSVHLRNIAAFSPRIVQVGDVEDMSRKDKSRFKDTRLFKKGPIVVCADPGGVASNIWNVTPPNFFKKIVHLDSKGLQTCAQGAELMVKLAFEDPILISHYVYWQNFHEPLLPKILRKFQMMTGILSYCGPIKPMSVGYPYVKNDAEESAKWWALSEVLVEGAWDSETSTRLHNILAAPSLLLKKEKSLLNAFTNEPKQPAVC
eukprot:GDKJ01033150.1.p1 GENE.GDKJ01033150.1~~GDKJ01033150.1.p1  ORF type:complete len:437 (+),score=84.51 GDKJ01033150.1:153-1463(+)